MTAGFIEKKGSFTEARSQTPGRREHKELASPILRRRRSKAAGGERGREKVKRDQIKNLRTTLFRNFKISEQGSPDFTKSRNFPEFHANQVENVLSKFLNVENDDLLNMLYLSLINVLGY